MPAVLLTEAWWRARARLGLAPGRWQSARMLRHVLLPALGATAAGWILSWGLPNVAGLCVHQPQFPLLLLLAVCARGAFVTVRTQRNAARAHWLQAAPLSTAQRCAQQWLLASVHAVARALPLGLMLCVAAARTSLQTPAALLGRMAGAVAVMLLGACAGGLLGLRRPRVRVLPPQPAIEPGNTRADSSSLPALLWRWQSRRLRHLRPDRHKLWLAVLALAVPMGTPVGVAAGILVSGWLLASAIDVLDLHRATLREVLALTRACITAPWRWALLLLPMPALVVTVGSLLAGALASAAGLTAQGVPVTLILLVVSGSAAWLPILWTLRRHQRLFAPWS